MKQVSRVLALAQDGRIRSAKRGPMSAKQLAPFYGRTTALDPAHGLLSSELQARPPGRTRGLIWRILIPSVIGEFSFNHNAVRA